MKKHYHAALILFVGVMVVTLSVGLSPQGSPSGEGLTITANQAHAEDESSSYGSDGYSDDGYDRDGHDRDGYSREGYSDDGHDRDGDYEERYDKKKVTSGSAQTFKAKPVVKQY